MGFANLGTMGEVSWAIGHLPTTRPCYLIPKEFKGYYESSMAGHGQCNIRYQYFKYTEKYRLQHLPSDIKWKLGHLPVTFRCAKIPDNFKKYYEPIFMGVGGWCKIQTRYLEYTWKYTIEHEPPPEPEPEPEPEPKPEPKPKPSSTGRRKTVISREPIGRKSVTVFPNGKPEGIFTGGMLGGTFIPILIVMVVGGVGYYFYSRRKR